MDLQNAINKGHTMKFSPPNLRFVIGQLKAVQEMMGLDHGCWLITDKNNIQLSVQAVDGIFNLLTDISERIERIASEEVGKQIDDAPEPETEVQEKGKAPETETAEETAQGLNE